VGWCEPGTDPCPGQLCDEVNDVCAPCSVDADCSDGFFCNGPERCVAGVCHPGAYPCGSSACDENADACNPAGGNPLLAWVPVSATGASCIDGNRITLVGGGQQVTLELFLSNWDTDHDGSPLLGMYQGTVEPDSYLGETASPPNAGVDLVPLGWPAAPGTGAFIDATRGDFVLGDPAAQWALSDGTLDYAWGAAGSLASWPAGVADPGSPRYAATLVLTVPANAAGTYTVYPSPDPDRTFMTDSSSCRLADPYLGPAVISVVPVDAPTVGDDTCYAGLTNVGTPCGVDSDCATGEVCGLKSRYLSLVPSNPAVATALQVTVESCPQFPGIVGDVWYAGPEQPLANPPHPGLRGAPLQCTTTPHTQIWTAGSLYLWGSALVPGSTYSIRQCNTSGECSCPLFVATAKWGDVVTPFGGGAQPNFADINATVLGFQGSATAPEVPRTDQRGPGVPGTANTPDDVANFMDINADVAAFQGSLYPYTAPACP